MEFPTPPSPPSMFMCSFCQGCFPTQAALGRHLIDHNRLLALDTGHEPRALAPGLPHALAPSLASSPLPMLSAPASLTNVMLPRAAPPLPPPLPPSPAEVLPWTPPTRPASPPTRSAAPPARPAVPPGYTLGTVTYYNVPRSFGSIKRANLGGEKVHFYLTACTLQTPPPMAGEEVFFIERRGPKGPIADVVKRIPGKAFGSPKAAFLPGTVKSYQLLGGFGTIVTDDGAELSFRGHSCDVVRPPPTVGERVQAKPSVGPKGPIASEVRRPNVQADPAAYKSKPNAKTAPVSVKKIHAAKLMHSTAIGERIAEQTRELLQDLPSDFRGSKHPRYIYIDLDNIWVSFTRAEHIIGKFPGAESTRDLVLHLEGLSDHLTTGGPDSSVARLVVFYFNTPASIANGFRKFGRDGVSWEVRKQETVSDTTMQLELLSAKRPCEAHPKTLVLVTGDGNVAKNGMCFRDILDQYLRDGWFVEVHAWLATLARSYIEFQRQYSTRVVIQPLDNYLEQVVMLRKVYEKRLAKANSSSSSTASDDDGDTALIAGIVTKYEVLGGYGTIAKLDGSGGELHLSILFCDIRRPPPAIGEHVMVAEGYSKKWGPCATTVRRVTISDDTDNVAPTKPGAKHVGTIAYDMETKAEHMTNESEALGATPVSQQEFSAALTHAMDTMTIDSTSTSVSTTEKEQAAEATPLETDSYEALIDLLSDPVEGEKHLSKAIAVLELAQPIEAATIQEMDPGTQRILLLNIFQDEVDSARFEDLATANHDGVSFAIERGATEPPSSPAGSSPPPVDHELLHEHVDPEPEPTYALQCDKCAADTPVDGMIFLSNCDHAFCVDCLRSYVDELDIHEGVKPQCLCDDCDAMLSFINLARVLSVEEQKAYCDALTPLVTDSETEAPAGF